MVYVEVYIRMLKHQKYQEYHVSWVYDYEKQWANREREDIVIISEYCLFA